MGGPIGTTAKHTLKLRRQRFRPPPGSIFAREALFMAEQVFLGRYKVTRPLDEGGMSRIYLARDPRTNCEVAVKVLKPEFLAQSKPREHFRREIHIMSRLEHPNAVNYLHAGPNDPARPRPVMD